MMKLLEIKWSGKNRKALVEMEFTNGNNVNTYWLVGELPFRGEDATIKLEYDLVGTLKFDYKADADKAFKAYGTAKTVSDAR